MPKTTTERLPPFHHPLNLRVLREDYDRLPGGMLNFLVQENPFERVRDCSNIIPLDPSCFLVVRAISERGRHLLDEISSF